MAKIYVNLIKNGIKTIDDVPVALKTEVQALLGAERMDEQEEERYANSNSSGN